MNEIIKHHLKTVGAWIVLIAVFTGIYFSFYSQSQASSFTLANTFFQNIYTASLNTATVKLSHLTVVNADSIATDQDIIVTESDGKILSISNHSDAVPDGAVNIDMTGLVAYPGIINSHDHFSTTWSSHVPRYLIEDNALDWMNTSGGWQQAAAYQTERTQFINFSKALGAYKQVFSGTTMASDFEQGDYTGSFNLPIKLTNTPYDTEGVYAGTTLETDNGGDYQTLVNNYNANVVAGNLVMAVHVEETAPTSLDTVTQAQLDTVKRKIGLHSNVLLVHGEGFSDQDVSDIVAAGASISWAPYSLWYITDWVANIPHWLDLGANVTLSTDGTGSGSENMLDELKFAKAMVPSLNGQDLFKMATINSAKAFHIDNANSALNTGGAVGTGSLVAGKYADILVSSRASSGNLYDDFVNLQSKDIALLLSSGKPVYGNDTYRAGAFNPYFASFPSNYETVAVDGISKFIIGKPTTLINTINTDLHTYSSNYTGKDFEFMPFDKSNASPAIPTMPTPIVTSVTDSGSNTIASSDGGTSYTTNHTDITFNGTTASTTNVLAVNWNNQQVTYTAGQTAWSYTPTYDTSYIPPEQFKTKLGVNYFEFRAKKNDNGYNGVGWGSGIFSKFAKQVITILPIANTPNGLTATPDTIQVDLAWNTVSGATTYYLYRSDSASGTYTKIATLTNPSYTDSNLDSGATYYYKISATNADIESAKSSSTNTTTLRPSGRRIVTPNPPPPTPTDLKAVAGNNQITLSWNPASSTAQYFIYKKTGNDFYYSDKSTTTKYVAKNLINDTVYYYKVSSVSADGNESDPSEVASSTSYSLPTNLSLIINDNATTTTSTVVTLSLSATNSASVIISNFIDFSEGQWATHTTSTLWTLTSGNGTKTVYAKFRTTAGHASSSIYAKIILDSPNEKTPKPIVIPVVNATSSTPIFDSDTIKTATNPDIYIIKIVGTKKFKRLILSPQVFTSYAQLKWSKIKVVPQTDLDIFTTSNLVREINDTKVYQLNPDGDTGTKQWLNMTADEFTDENRDWDSIYIINAIDRDNYTVGDDIISQPDTATTASSTPITASSSPATLSASVVLISLFDNDSIIILILSATMLVIIALVAYYIFRKR